MVPYSAGTIPSLSGFYLRITRPKFNPSKQYNGAVASRSPPNSENTHQASYPAGRILMIQHQLSGKDMQLRLWRFFQGSLVPSSR